MVCGVCELRAVGYAVVFAYGVLWMLCVGIPVVCVVMCNWLLCVVCRVLYGVCSCIGVVCMSCAVNVGCLLWFGLVQGMDVIAVFNVCVALCGVLCVCWCDMHDVCYVLWCVCCAMCDVYGIVCGACCGYVSHGVCCGVFAMVCVLYNG